MMDKDDKYVVIKDVKRINVRYYLIQIDNKSYIIDYVNPKDLRNYVAWFFISINKEWKLYDVTGKEKNYVVKSPPLYQNPIRTVLLFILIICYIINIESASAKINLRELTRDPRIIQYWGLAVGFVLAIGLVIITILYYKETDIILTKQSQKLVRYYNPSKRFLILTWFGPVGLFILMLVMGILDGNYANLIAYGGVPLYTLVFSKFVSFLDIKRNKYYIVENEGVVDGSA